MNTSTFLDAATVAQLGETPTAKLPWPPHRPVAWLPGSLPMGGVVPDTPIHAFVTPAPALALSPDPDAIRPTRHDIDLGGLLAFEIRGLMRPAEADAIVDATERFGYRDEAPASRPRPACA